MRCSCSSSSITRFSKYVPIKPIIHTVVLDRGNFIFMLDRVQYLFICLLACLFRYDLMNADHLSQLPVGDFLSSDGLVAVWCTNSAQQIKTLIDRIFPLWDIQYLTTWYWIKVIFHFFL